MRVSTEDQRMEVAAALLDASRKLSEKDVSTGNVSTTSCSSWTSSNNELSDGRPNSTGQTSWFSNSWTGSGQRKRALSETVSSSEKAATMSWLGMFPAGNKQSQDGNTINIPIPQTNTRVRRVSCKGIETAMAGGLGKVWYDS